MSKQKHTLQQRCQPISRMELFRIGAISSLFSHNKKRKPHIMAEKIYYCYDHRQGVHRKANNTLPYKIAVFAIGLLALPVIWLISNKSDAAQAPKPLTSLGQKITHLEFNPKKLDAIIAYNDWVDEPKSVDDIIADIHEENAPPVDNSLLTWLNKPVDASATIAAQVSETKVNTPSQSAQKPTDAKTKKSNSDWLSITVKSGDNLSSIFDRYDLDRGDLHLILKQQQSASLLRSLKPGQELRIKPDKNGAIQSLALEVDLNRELQIHRAENDEPAQCFKFEFNNEELSQIPSKVVKAKKGTGKLIKNLASVSVTIENNLYADARKAGLSRHQASRIAKIFRWDIDFGKDIKIGDQFTVLHEEYLNEDGERVKTGQIVAAEFINDGKRYQSVYYVDPKGRGDYHNPNGKIMRKSFLRTPVNAGKITSRFSIARLNPILHKIRAHRGVDYAAPVGTPVYAAGDAVVEYKGWKNGYGRTLILKHGDKYSTVYAHLSRFAAVNVGQSVSQGKIIGYIGSSGRATGPHLHYEFLVNGVHKDPLKVTGLEQQSDHSIPLKYRDDFRKKSKILLARLNELRQVAQIKADNNPRKN